jgi:hypothetical protein
MLEKGLGLINEAATAEPQEAEIRAHLADTYRRLGQTEKAKQEFDAALRLGPDDTVLRFIEAKQKLLGVPVTPAIRALSEDEAVTAMADVIRQREFKPDPRMSTDSLGIAIHGFDPVAYFISGHPAPGQPRYFEIWNGAIWLFTTDGNRNRFTQDPEHYAPAYGGYCSYCMAIGHKVHSDPNAWAVHENKLYLHQTTGIRDGWLKDPDKYIKDADRQWSNLAEKMISPEPDYKITKKVLAAIKAQQ